MVELRPFIGEIDWFDVMHNLVPSLVKVKMSTYPSDVPYYDMNRYPYAYFTNHPYYVQYPYYTNYMDYASPLHITQTCACTVHQSLSECLRQLRTHHCP